MTEANTHSQESERGFRLSEAAFLAALPVVAYWANFMFEIGVANALGFPVSFISLGFRDLILTTAFVLPILTLVSLLYGSIPTLGLSISMYVAASVALVVAASKTIGLLHDWRVTSVLVAAIALDVLFTIWLVARDIVVYVKNVKSTGAKGLDSWWVDTPWSLDPVVAARFGLTPRSAARWAFVVIAIIASSFLLPASGAAYAHAWARYLVPIGMPNSVVLRRYEDRFVIANVDRAAKIVGPIYRLVPLDDPGVAGLQYEIIGPLRPRNGSQTRDSVSASPTR